MESIAVYVDEYAESRVMRKKIYEAINISQRY
jgi:hypothetical protein